MLGLWRKNFNLGRPHLWPKNFRAIWIGLSKGS